MFAALLFSAAAGSPTYRAAVAQLPIASGVPIEQKHLFALGQIENASRAAARRGAQILVLSEGVVGGMWDASNEAGCEPVPGPSAAPLCGSPAAPRSPLSANASCLAREHRLVLVLNLCDRVPCAGEPGCPARGFFKFNSQLAISETGAVLAKYHKTHLYDNAPGVGESESYDYPPRPAAVFFDTSFGVRFGLFICFDILFRHPAAALALEHNVSNFAFSTHWESPGPPMLPAVAVQQGFSRALGVNVLGANAGRRGALSQSQGSGIYSAGEAVAYRFSPTAPDDTFLLVADVPVEPARRPDLRGLARASAAALPHAAALGRSSARRGGHGASPEPAYGPADSTGLGAATMVQFDAAANRSSAGLVASAPSGFTCTLTYELDDAGRAGASTGSTYALLALDGAWFRGVLHSRSCAALWCPAGRCTDDPLTPSAAGFDARLGFRTLQLRGSFARGDLVLPFLTTAAGQLVRSAASWESSGGSMRVELDGAPLLHAMLLADTGGS